MQIVTLMFQISRGIKKEEKEKHWLKKNSWFQKMVNENKFNCINTFGFLIHLVWKLVLRYKVFIAHVFIIQNLINSTAKFFLKNLMIGSSTNLNKLKIQHTLKIPYYISYHFKIKSKSVTNCNSNVQFNMIQCLFCFGSSCSF